MSAPMTFKDAMQEFRPVTVPLLVADMGFAGWLVIGQPARPSVILVSFIFATAVLWVLTMAVCAAFAWKHQWWTNRRVRAEAGRIAARLRGEARMSRAHDLLTCPGPCPNKYGCMVGVCVVAASRRMAEFAPASEASLRRSSNKGNR